MAISNSESKKEISEIISGISSDDRPIVSAGSALKVVASFPLLMLISHMFLFFIFCAVIITSGDNTAQPLSFYYEAILLILQSGWGALTATLGLSVLWVLINFSTALVYVSIPEDIRKRSQVISSVTLGVKKLFFFLWVGAMSLSLIGLFSDWAMLFSLSIPTMLFISLFIVNGYLGVQSARYGLGPLMSAAKMVLSKQNS